MPWASSCVSNASTSSSISSSACTSSSNSDRFTQPRSSPRASIATTSGREVNSCATWRMLRRRRARCGKPVEGASQQSRHVHLRDADLLGYLGLGQVLLEAQAQDHALTSRQRLERATQRLLDLDAVVALVLLRERLAERPALVLAVARARRVQGHRLVGGRRL